MNPTVIAFIFACSLVSAANYYVSPYAVSGDGSFANPGTFQGAMTNSEIGQGDFVWCRGGTYSGLFSATLKSTSSNSPVIVRNFNRERAIIDGQLAGSNSSTNVWFWGLEFIDSHKADRSNPFDTIHGFGRGAKFINCLIHDCCIGIAGGESSGPQEAYGNVFWNCGKSQLEHALYWQNSWDETRTIESNLIGYSAGFGVHCFSSGGALKNLRIVNNGIWVSSDKTDILLGGGLPVVNGVIESNQTWNSGGRGIELGYSVSQNSNAVVSGNYDYAAYTLYLHTAFDNLSVTNNIISDAYASCVRTSGSSETTTTADWDHNRYYGLGGFPWVTYFWFQNDSAFVSWEGYRTATGWDSHSSYVSNIYAPNIVTLIPNKYESKRANILCWNWTGEHNASVDVSGLLSVGDRYEVRWSQNWFSGPVMRSTYFGGPITVPLTNLPGPAEHLFWSGWSAGYRTNTNLFAFILIPAPPKVNFNSAHVGNLIINSR